MPSTIKIRPITVNLRSGTGTETSSVTKDGRPTTTLDAINNLKATTNIHSKYKDIEKAINKVHEKFLNLKEMTNKVGEKIDDKNNRLSQNQTTTTTTTMMYKMQTPPPPPPPPVERHRTTTTKVNELSSTKSTKYTQHHHHHPKTEEFGTTTKIDETKKDYFSKYKFLHQNKCTEQSQSTKIRPATIVTTDEANLKKIQVKFDSRRTGAGGSGGTPRRCLNKTSAGRLDGTSIISTTTTAVKAQRPATTSVNTSSTHPVRTLYQNLIKPIKKYDENNSERLTSK